MLIVSQITQITQILLAVGVPCRTTRLSDVTFDTIAQVVSIEVYLINRLKQPWAKLVVNIKYSASYFVSNIVVSHCKLFMTVTNKAEEYCVRQPFTVR